MLVLPSTLTSREARDTLRLLQQTLKAEGGEAPVVVDASRLQQLDSSALAVLLELDRSASGWNRDFEVHGAPAKLQSLGKLYGVDRLLWRSGADNASGPVPQRSPAL